MRIEKDFIVRILKTGGYPSTIVGNYIVLEQKTVQGYTVSIAHYDAGIELEVWIETGKTAWSEVPIALPESPNAYLSKCVRWVIGKIMDATFAENP